MKKDLSYSRIGLVLFLFGVMIVFAFKAINEDWFSPREPLVLDGKHALILFNRYKGCECELVVYQAAEEQFENWSQEKRKNVQKFVFNLDRRPDLKQQFNIIRAPTLILVDGSGNIILKQDVGITDTEPLNLPLFEEKIKEVLNGK